VFSSSLWWVLAWWWQVLPLVADGLASNVAGGEAE